MAEPASDSMMAAEALAPFATREPTRQQQQLEEHRDRLYGLAQNSPDMIRPATVVFNTGLTANQLQRLVEDMGLEVIDAHAKAAHGSRGVVMSIMFGMADLLASSGDLSSRLSFVIAGHQKCFAKRAKFAPAEDAQDWTNLATQPFLVYSARVFGSASALDKLQSNSSVTSVMLNVRQSVVTDFQARKFVNEPSPYQMSGFLC